MREHCRIKHWALTAGSLPLSQPRSKTDYIARLLGDLGLRVLRASHTVCRSGILIIRNIWVLNVS
jgi:hypothetical protein